MKEAKLLDISELSEFDKVRARNEWIVQARNEWTTLGIAGEAKEGFITQYLEMKRKDMRFFYLDGILYSANIQVVRRL